VSQALRLRLAINVINRRHAQGFSQAQLAARAGLHRSHIGSIEQAHINVSIDTIGAIADALGVDAEMLLTKAASAARSLPPCVP